LLSVVSSGFRTRPNYCWQPQQQLFKKVESDKVVCKDIRSTDCAL
jgi:hypothetical protein